MKIESLWIVRDPEPTSELADILFPIPIDRLPNYVTAMVMSHSTMGSSAREVWSRLNHAVYAGDDAEAMALADALARLRPLHEGAAGVGT